MGRLSGRGIEADLVNAPAKPIDGLMEVQSLKTHFAGRRGPAVRALDGVSFSLARNESLGVVGESGCGKTTLGRTIAGLYRPTAGSIRFHPDVAQRDCGQARAAPGRVQMVFQDPFGSFNQRMTAHQILAEPLRAAGERNGTDAIGRAVEAVGLGAAALKKYAHEFSGGQRQRLAIARAIVTRPALMIADEAVAALDVSVQAQILNLLADLKASYQVAYLFISHDLSVVEHVSDRIAVMYAGQIVELGPTANVVGMPRHPYTRALLSAVSGVKGSGALQADGEAPSPLAYPTGCRFHPRCSVAEARCSRDQPAERAFGPDHRAGCHLA